MNLKQHNKNKFTLGKIIIYLQKGKSRDQHLKVVKKKKGGEGKKQNVGQTVQVILWYVIQHH